jgi:hypothetical protein
MGMKMRFRRAGAFARPKPRKTTIEHVAYVKNDKNTINLLFK